MASNKSGISKTKMPNIEKDIEYLKYYAADKKLTSLKKLAIKAIKDTISKIKRDMPEDDTTADVVARARKEAYKKAKAGNLKYGTPVEYEDKNGNKSIRYNLKGIPWLMDNFKSKEQPIEIKTRISRKNGVLNIKVVSDNIYIPLLEDGNLNESPLLKNAQPVERTDDGRFSEQSPNGNFMRDNILKALRKAKLY